MTLPRDAMLLRVFIGENDRSPEGRPLYEAIVLKARDVHLAGATVLRGPMGFGHASRLHTSKILRLSEDLPLIIEIVDTEAKVKEFLPILNSMMTSGTRHPGKGPGAAIRSGREARPGLRDSPACWGVDSEASPPHTGMLERARRARGPGRR